ncbi:putative mitochondrial protein [Tanacetum coccineum]
MVGTRGTLANTSISGNAGVNHDNSSGLDAHAKDFIKQLIDSAMQEHVDDLDKDEYKQALLARFDTDFEDPLSELKNLKCDSTVQKYHENFELMFKSKSLADAASFCKLQEVTIAPHKARQSLVLPLQKPNIVSVGFGNKGRYVNPRNQTYALTVPTIKFNAVNLTRKYLSQKEFDDKRAKGLCFQCDQKFVSGHKCSGQAFALELIIDSGPQMEMCLMEGNEEQFVLLEVTNEEIPQISLNALTSLTSYRTIRELLDSKAIRPSYSPFSSPIVMVKKKDGTQRICIDYRKLNKLTIKDKFPIPLIEELINELYGSKVFSKLDLRSGYHQIRMDEKDIPKATFKTHEGHYEIMFTLVFFDDILVYSASVTDHLQHLKSIMTVIRENSLHAKKSKYVFGIAQVKYLRHVILNQGVTTDPAKISAMVDWPTPTTLKQLRGFIGLNGYYRRFIKNYRVIAQPLTALLKRNAF